MKTSAQQPSSSQQENCSWVEEVYRAYSQLSSAFVLDREQGMGGSLVYAGQLSADRGQSPADAWIAAANIAGAATLAAAPTPESQRRAMRDALVDFVVNSMEEALRILKNEVRQRRAVSVAVAVSAVYLMEEMLRRGVRPDALAAPNATPAHENAQSAFQREAFLRQGARLLDATKPGHFVTWRQEKCCGSSATPAETAAREIATDAARQRWLRLAPRYLGRAAQRAMGVGIRAEEQAAWEAALRRASAFVGGKRLEASVEVIQA